MFLTATVTKWQDNKYSGRRVSPRDNGTRQFILNTSYLHDITANGSGSKFYLTDRRYARREQGAYLEITQSVADIRTAGDTVVSKMITLPVYRNNNPSRATDNIIINTENLIYADRYNPDPINLSWVLIADSSFKEKSNIALVNLSIEEILTASSLLKDYDGNGYTTVTIGTQEWLIENLRVKHYSDGSAISNITDDDLWQADIKGAYCYYDNDEANFDYIGLLYNWYACTNLNGLAYFERSGVQEVGWRIPTFADWTALVGAIGGVLHGGDLKEVGFVHWWPPNDSATDLYGFKGISGGNRYIDMWFGDGFDSQGEYGDYWSSDENPFDSDEGTSVFLYYDNGIFVPFDCYKFNGMTVRCVRDSI